MRHLGAPYLTRYRLYVDAVAHRDRYKKIAKLLTLCDGKHTMLQMCEQAELPFADVAEFFGALDREGLLL